MFNKYLVKIEKSDIIKNLNEIHISNLTCISFALNNNFSERWKDNVILSTLKSQSLYRITFDESYSRIITYEKIRIGKRIRDVVYDEKNKIIFLAEENDDGSIGVLKIKK